MKRLASIGCVVVVASGCASSTSAGVPSPPVAQSTALASPSVDSPSPATVGGSVSPSPSPPPAASVSCKREAGATSLFLMGLPGYEQLLYDVSDPLHPRLVCTIDSTSAHLFTGDTFVYLKPISTTETDIVLHSLGSGNESVSGTLPFAATVSTWTPDGSLAAYLTPPTTDASGLNRQPVWLFAQQKTAQVYSYRLGIGDCICRFGLPPQVLTLSPDGQYLVAGWLVGKGSVPLAVVRLSDGKLVYTAPPDAIEAIWGRAGHQLLLYDAGGPTVDSWSPEGGLVPMHAIAWLHLPGLSPDGTQLAYTADSDDSVATQPPRVFVYSLSGGAPRMLVDQPRTQVVFVKDGWVWYLDEGPCTNSCAGLTAPTGRVYAMNLATGVEQTVSFADGEAPLSRPDTFWGVFSPGEFWPNS